MRDSLRRLLCPLSVLWVQVSWLSSTKLQPAGRIMSGVQIRKFQEEDAESVKEVFTLGMSEHIPSSFMHVLKQSLTQMVLMCTFCALVTSSQSFLLPILAVTLLLAGARLGIIYMFNRYIEVTLSGDLRDVTNSYLRSQDSCFWVAESEGRVVGTVACLPAENAPGCLELKRITVRRSHRGRGIAKALCRTVADFTRDRGYAAVVLYTSMVQTDAQKLYEHMGYKKIREFAAPEVAAKVLNFMLYEYRLDLYGEGVQGW
ncbi:N-acetyltransferase 8 [Oryzias melastigma]|uniref:N-acetyltransferase 8 n=1 Tax=Oryzias melastigma TaxID=30732 RepID=A0A834F846_ORYME|nr:N-acetyltransferase 8 [Oryzias melastigma]